MKELTVKIKPLTPLWTGNHNRKCETLRETGIIGSLRWWYEALIRGLGGSACDPTSDNNRCPDRNGKHCDACELFGCTGWARKFRLEIEKINGGIRLHFIELRKIKNIEWALLNKTLEIIAKHGAIGGKLVEPQYGLIEIKENDLEKFILNKIDLNKYLKKKGKSIENPNFKRFIFINYDLRYQIVKDLKENFPFIKGKKGVGKKYFYKTFRKRPCRLFVYTESDKENSQIIKYLNEKSINFETGKKILEGFV